MERVAEAAVVVQVVDGEDCVARALELRHEGGGPGGEDQVAVGQGAAVVELQHPLLGRELHGRAAREDRDAQGTKLFGPRPDQVVGALAEAQGGREHGLGVLVSVILGDEGDGDVGGELAKLAGDREAAQPRSDDDDGLHG
ncbi:hypothetical protein D3C87_1692650 [compost metagenome]